MWTPDDTTEDAWRAQHEAWRRMGGAGRFRAAFEASEQVREMSVAGIRARNPDFTEAQVRLAGIKVWLGEELFVKAYGGVALELG